MPALHAYFPTTPGRDATWAFAQVRAALGGDRVAFEEKANPFTKQVNLKAVVDDAFHLTFSFETGRAADDDLATIRGREASGFSRIRVLYSPDEDGEYTDTVVVDVLTFFESIDPVLVYGVDAGQVFTDTLPA